MTIDIQNVGKHFGAFTALDGINLHIDSGELVALLGPSGYGKTTLLRIIAGLEQADTGSIRFEGEDTTRRSARERRVEFVFQHYTLFKHMTVFDNVAFGLQVRPRDARPSKEEIREKVMVLLRLVQLDWTAKRYLSQLSGGQRQRAALARALAVGRLRAHPTTGHGDRARAKRRARAGVQDSVHHPVGTNRPNRAGV